MTTFENTKIHNGRETGGYLMLQGDKPFAKRVNEILGNYWVSSGCELDVFEVMLEVLAEKYNNDLLNTSKENK